MDTGALQSKLKQKFGAVVLQKQKFGRSPHLTLWIEGKAIRQVAEFLKSDSELKMDWLENLSVMQMDGSLVLTYFLRSTEKKGLLILRASVAPKSPRDTVDFPSVSSVWATATPMENESGELFGIRFVTPEGRAAGSRGGRLPPGWEGFPLRKDYVFPTEVMGIAHSRAMGSSHQDVEER